MRCFGADLSGNVQRILDHAAALVVEFVRWFPIRPTRPTVVAARAPTFALLFGSRGYARPSATTGLVSEPILAIEIST